MCASVGLERAPKQILSWSKSSWAQWFLFTFNWSLTRTQLWGLCLDTKALKQLRLSANCHGGEVSMFLDNLWEFLESSINCALVCEYFTDIHILEIWNIVFFGSYCQCFRKKFGTHSMYMIVLYCERKASRGNVLFALTVIILLTLSACVLS